MTQIRSATEFEATMFVRANVLAVVVALTAALAGCDGASRANVDSTMAKAAKVVAHDCRSPEAQSVQRGCRSLTVTMGSL